MGRLFWKFFGFLFLAHVLMGLSLSVAFWFHNQQQVVHGIEQSPPARSLVEATSSTLRYAGLSATKPLLIEWQDRRHNPQVYVIDVEGHDVLGRAINADIVKVAEKVLSESGAENFVHKVVTPEGAQYLVFVPDFRDEHGQPRGGEPPMGSDDLSGDHPPPPPEFSDLRGPPPDLGHASDMPPPPNGTEAFSRNDTRILHIFPLRPLIAGLIVSFISAWILAWYFSTPIQHLRYAFNEAANGNLAVRVGNAMGSRRDELADLGHDFDLMAARIGSLIQSQTRLLHHVSHELRSPLARLQMAVGLARQRPDKIDSTLDRIERESMMMDKLVGELLELSKLESGMTHLTKERIEFADLLATVVEDAQFEADAKSMQVVFDGNHSIAMMAQPDLLHRAIENVVRNAIKYGPEASVVSLHVDVLSTHQKLVLTVHDQGMGVAENELEGIFQPFVRGTNVMTGNGHGVGLAIAKQVIEAHGGEIHAKNISTGGFAVVITLPCLG